MVEPTKSEDIGMKQGRVIGQLTPEEQLDIIADGLPSMSPMSPR